MQTIVPPMSLADPRDDQTEDRHAVALIALHDRTVDSVKGHVKMVEKAEPAFRDIAEQFRALHARHAGDLARLLADLGVEAESDGTIMGTVNQAVVTFRAFFDDIDEDVMDQVRSGEDWVLKAFDAAIEEQQSAERLGADQVGIRPVAKLREMRAELVTLLDETRDLG